MGVREELSVLERKSVFFFFKWPSADKRPVHKSSALRRPEKDNVSNNVEVGISVNVNGVIWC